MTKLKTARFLPSLQATGVGSLGRNSLPGSLAQNTEKLVRNHRGSILKSGRADQAGTDRAGRDSTAGERMSWAVGRAMWPHPSPLVSQGL